MATVTEESVDIKHNNEPVCHDATSAIEAQIRILEAVQQIKTEIKQELQNEEKNLPQSEGNNKNKIVFVECAVNPDKSILYKNETEEENSGNVDCTVDVNMDVENSVSEDVQVKSESVCVIEDNFLKIEKVYGNVHHENISEDENEYSFSQIDLVSDESNSETKSSKIKEDHTDCETHSDTVTKTEIENGEFDWEKLFTPPPTYFIYPEDEKEIEKLAATLWEMKNELFGRNHYDIVNTCNFASQWKTISEDSKKFVYQRMMLLYLAVTKGWRYALKSTSVTNDEHSRKRSYIVGNFRGSYRPRKMRRMNFRSTAIPNQQTGQLVSPQ